MKTFHWNSLTLIFSLMVLAENVSAQQDSIVAGLLNNDSLKFDFIFKTPGARNPSDPSIDLVIIHMPKETRQYLLEKDSTFWLQKLSNEKTDWAANLLLYCVYKKDAFLIKKLYPERRKWLTYKKEDINYWKKFFRHKK